MVEVDTSNQITIGGHKQPIGEIAKYVGYQNSAVFCRNLDELIGVITHGRIDKAISPEDAQKVGLYLVEHKYAEEVVAGDGTIGWHILKNEEAINLEWEAK